MKVGKLEFDSLKTNSDLVAEPVLTYIESNSLDEVLVSAIDADLADTAAFCEAYEIGLDVSANCVVVEAKRGDEVWYAACLILATCKADVNGVVRRNLEARKTSFAPMDIAISLTNMEYGGITPIGLPSHWAILVDESIMEKDNVIIGSGIRGSKLLVPPSVFNRLPNSMILDIKKQ